MNVFSKGLTGLPAFQSLCADIRADRLPAAVTGLGHIHKVHFIASLSAVLNRRAVLIVADEGEAARVSRMPPPLD